VPELKKTETEVVNRNFADQQPLPGIEIISTDKKKYFESPEKPTGNGYFANIEPANLLSPEHPRVNNHRLSGNKKKSRGQNDEEKGPSSPTSSVGTRFYMERMEEEESNDDEIEGSKMEEDALKAISSLQLSK
jgi:hypothetical protein